MLNINKGFGCCRDEAGWYTYGDVGDDTIGGDIHHTKVPILFAALPEILNAAKKLIPEAMIEENFLFFINQAPTN